MNKSYNSEIVNWKAVAIAAGLLFLGIFCLYNSQGDEYWAQSPIKRVFIRDAGSLLCVTGILNIVWDVILRRKFLDEIIEKTGIALTLKNAGIKKVSDTFNDYKEIDWKDYFSKVNQLDLFFAYAASWRGVHKEDLKNLSKRKCSINLILPDPDNDKILEELARRFSSNAIELRRKINEAKSDFESLRNSLDCQAKINIYFVNTSPQYTFYRFDDVAIIALYDHSQEKNPVPTFVCERGGTLYNFVQQDFNALTRVDGNISRKV